MAFQFRSFSMMGCQVSYPARAPVSLIVRIVAAKLTASPVDGFVIGGYPQPAAVGFLAKPVQACVMAFATRRSDFDPLWGTYSPFSIWTKLLKTKGSS